MGSERESSFGADFSRVLRQQGAMTYPLIAGKYAPPGWPDRLVWHRKWHGLIELKGHSTRYRPDQLPVHRRLNLVIPGSAFGLRKGVTNSHTNILEYEGDEVRRCTLEELLDALRSFTTELRGEAQCLS